MDFCYIFMHCEDGDDVKSIIDHADLKFFVNSDNWKIITSSDTYNVQVWQMS